MSCHPLSAALKDAPIHAPETLGRPIPDSEFAVSVSLPRWDDVIGYEERDPRVVDAMATGYPRFFVHPAVTQMIGHALAEHGNVDLEGCLPFPSQAAASRCLAFINRIAGAKGRVFEVRQWHVFLVFYPVSAAMAAKAFWQHSGEGLSTRHAVAAMRGDVVKAPSSEALDEVIGRLADVYGAPANCVFLHSTGMASIWASFRALKRLKPAGATVQFGFPYVDTLKLHETTVDTHHFLPIGDAEDLKRLSGILSEGPVAGVYCEVPSNPLLRTPDLLALRRLTADAGVPLVVDDTLAAFYNLDVLPHCDLVACSLTKYFSGVGDVMGGALIVNPDAPHAGELAAIFAEESPADRVYAEDLSILAERSRSVERRVRTVNERAEALAEFLNSHPAVETVNYPSRQDPNVSAILRADGGLGGLLSFTLKTPEKASVVYDSLPFCKGPNLGMDYTLCCPFTILAHYDELDFAKRCGVSQDLIRVAVGTETLEVIVDGFDQALAHA